MTCDRSPNGHHAAYAPEFDIDPSEWGSTAIADICYWCGAPFLPTFDPIFLPEQRS